MRNAIFALTIAAVAGAGWLALRWVGPKAVSAETFAALYATPLPAPAGPVATYHLGHSLVGRDMPAMLAQLAGHDHASQLGWGASLRDHWKDSVPGFAEENAHPAHRPAAAALASGDYGAVVLTEMVEIRDAIRSHDSARHLALWADRARAANPDARVYLYETWHRLDDTGGWLERIDSDLARHWEGDVLRPALARHKGGPIHVIPGGQVMAAAVRAIEAGEVEGVTSRHDLFQVQADGTQDMIHFNDTGAYLIALAHFAVLYHRSPEGMAHDLLRADGTPMAPLSADAALALQKVVWRVVTGYAPTGVAAQPG